MNVIGLLIVKVTHFFNFFFWSSRYLESYFLLQIFCHQNLPSIAHFQNILWSDNLWLVLLQELCWILVIRYLRQQILPSLCFLFWREWNKVHISLLSVTIPFIWSAAFSYSGFSNLHGSHFRMYIKTSRGFAVVCSINLKYSSPECKWMIFFEDDSSQGISPRGSLRKLTKLLKFNCRSLENSLICFPYS